MFDTPLSHEIIFAGLGIFVSIIRYGLYLWSIYKRETKPHVFSWLNWGVVTSIAAFAQFKLGGGPSVWVLATVAATCLFIAFLALFIGEKEITRSDWAAFIGAIISIILWQLTDNPLVAIVMVMLIDALSYYPTIRKSWRNPWGEPPVSYLWAGLRYFLILFSVPNATVSTLAYPFFLMSIDWSFALFVFWRRRKLGKGKDLLYKGV